MSRGALISHMVVAYLDWKATDDTSPANLMEKLLQVLEAHGVEAATWTPISKP